MVSSISGLVLGVHANDRVVDLAVDGGHGLGHALAQIALLVAVAQLNRLVCTGRCPRRHGSPAERSVFQRHVHFNSRVAALSREFRVRERG
jgi:hypothetical protein